MFGTLLESRRSCQWRLAGTAASVAAHACVIAVAMVTGASATTRRPPEPKDPPPGLVWVEPRTRARVLDRSSHSWTSGAQLAVDWLPDLRIRHPHYQDLDLRARVAHERDLVGDLATDTGPTGCIGHCRENLRPDPSGFGGAPATIATVDRAAFLVSPPRPRYPERLRTAGVTGRVVVRFVVDTLGRVEPASIVIRESSHDLFVEAVRGTLPTLAFVPAEAGGRKVRMLVDLPFEFRLND
jgi:periplasmic protein TonB